MPRLSPTNIVMSMSMSQYSQQFNRLPWKIRPKPLKGGTPHGSWVKSGLTLSSVRSADVGNASTFTIVSIGLMDSGPSDSEPLELLTQSLVSWVNQCKKQGKLGSFDYACEFYLQIQKYQEFGTKTVVFSNVLQQNWCILPIGKRKCHNFNYCYLFS